MAVGLRHLDTAGPRHSMVGYAHGLLAELRRRRAFRVSASHLVGMWILLQMAKVTLAPLHFPAWCVSAPTILAVIGLPIVIVLASKYEITSDGVVRDSFDVAAALHLPTSRCLVAPIIVIGIVLMAMVTGYAW